MRGVLHGAESYGSPGVENIEWTHPVRPGDSLRLKATVLETRVSSSKRTGIVRIRWELLNQADVLVLRLVGTSFFAIYDEQATRPAPGSLRRRRAAVQIRAPRGQRRS